MSATKAEALTLLLLFAGGAPAADAPMGQAEDPPSMELLEFLGGFETPEGEWFDPLLMVEESQSQAQPKVNGDD
jgi:hypothetical protein